MLRSIKRIFVLAVTLGMLLGGLNVQGNANNDYIESEVYSVDTELFEYIIENPSNKDMASNENVTVCTYSKSETNNGYLKRSVITNGTTVVEEVKEGWFAMIGRLPVYNDLLDFTQSKEAIQSYLSSQGIEENIEDTLLLNVIDSDIPVTILVETDKNNYFITIELSCDLVGDIYSYTLYTQGAYKEKYGYKDGILKVNNKVINEGEYVKFQNTKVYMPFRTIMEGLGADIEWDNITGSVYMLCNGKEYILKTRNGFSLYENGGTIDMLLPPPGSYGQYSYKIIDDRIIMDDKTMSVIVSLVDAKIDIDYDKLIININTEK